jgi:hypothetical protein
MPYQVPPSKASVDQNKFEVELDGTTYRLPSLKYVKPALLEGTSTEGISGTRALFDHYAPGLFDAIEGADQLEGIMTAWGESSDITLGESQGSASS